MLESPLAIAETTAILNPDTRVMRILVIDDNELDRQRILRVCQKAGLAFDATEVAALPDLPAALNDTAFDLIFVDYLLTDATGLDALEMIAEHDNQSTAAAIMLAGEGQIHISVEAMRRGCSDYLTKSTMNVETLQKSIATALERRMLFSAIDDERSQRAEMEHSIREYANSCTAEMRSILSATLRRVRQLRTYRPGVADDYTTDLNTLEADIDRLWSALPEFQIQPAPRALAIAGPIEGS